MKFIAYIAYLAAMAVFVSCADNSKSASGADSSEPSENLVSTEAFDEQKPSQNDVEADKDLIMNLYKGFVFVFDFPDYMTEKEQDDFVNDNLTDKLKKKLVENNDYEDGGMAFYLFRTEGQDGDGPSKVTDISPLGDGWYRVKFLDMGIQAQKDILVTQGKIADFRD